MVVVILKVTGTHTLGIILTGGEGLRETFTEEDTFELVLFFFFGLTTWLAGS